MNESIAERALLAHVARQKESELRKEAAIVALRASAVNSILLAAENLDLEIDVDDIEPAVCSASITSPISAKWGIAVRVDEDLAIKIEWSARPLSSDGAKISVTADFSDQLYWDLPPGKTEKGIGGGTYACYGLNKSYGADAIADLADIGKQILLTRAARAAWRKKWAGREETES